MESDTDIEGEVGSLDETAVEQIRDGFTALDGLVIEAGFDSLLDPTKLVVRLDDGIGDADSCRFDVRWYQTGYYNFHHTDEQDVNFRFDYHPKPDAPNKHFHNPPDASSEHPQRSCITVTEPRQVTRAVYSLWRRAYEENSLTQVNYPTLLSRWCGFVEGGASYFYDALCRHRMSVRRERSLHRRVFGPSQP